MLRFPLAAAFAAVAGFAAAAPKVATDIAPVHALAARVMQGVGEPALILPPGASPHGYALRPSEARAVQEADLVFWIGPELSPWLEGPVQALGARATTVELAEVPGAVLLAPRTDPTFEPHEHGADGAHGHGDDHDHEEAAAKHAHGHDHDHDHDHGHAAEAGAAHGDDAHDAHDDHAHGDHAHGAVDPHLWLDPENARVWLDAMAAALAAADPANAATYAANAAAGRAELDALKAEIAATLAPVRGRGFVVFHDGYQYFERRFGVTAAGAVTVSDAAAPSAARVAQIRARLEELGAGCIFAEPQFPDRVVRAIADGTGARVGVIDPLGATLTPGPALYADLLRGVAASLRGCLAAS
jgi:zinc transport system substrate-binding protein